MNKQRFFHTVGLGVVSGLAWLAVHLKDSPYWWAPAGAALAAALAVQLPKVAPSIFGPLLVIMALSGSASCWLTKPPPVTPTAPDGGFADASAGQTFVDCSETDVHQAGLQLVDDVMTDLALGPALALPALEALLAVQATKLGSALALGALSCAVQWAVSEAQSHLARGQDSIEARKVANGKAWLTAHPVTFAGAP